MPAPTGKASVYARRSNASTLVPLEEDSDSDFNPGAYIPTPGKKRGRKSNNSHAGREPSESPPLKKRRRDTLANIGVKSSRTMKKKSAVPACPNLLLQYFGDLGIKPIVDSEDEEDTEEEESADDEREEEEEEAEPEHSEGPPPLPRSLAILSNKSTADEESVTEPEIDSEDDNGAEGLIPMKRSAIYRPLKPRRPAKKARVTEPDDSVTEPEDDEPRWIHSIPTPTVQRPSKPAVHSDSDTEPESDPEWALEDVERRPDFPLPEGQTLGEALVLDKNVKVPKSINAFLREYQRDGVRFFWNRYKEGRGGVLGDDMGLGK
ncbi:hypothetical protein FKP32DRAFT_1681383 [Trametes sanguinea]|nr:hypothetical protein FKP32DRAFT_1681383 [Trametes sanguinea]